MMPTSIREKSFLLILCLAAAVGWQACAAVEATAQDGGKRKAAAAKIEAKKTTPPLKGVRVERDIQYVPGGDEAQRLDLYLPEKPSDRPVPLLVWIHGGGWRGGSKAGSPSAGMISKGYVAASVEYRFSQKALFPAQIQDCQAALRWLRANSKKYNIDPDRIGVWGGSAGGHLSALVGTSGGKKAFAPIGGNEEQADRVQAVCNFYGPADFTTVMQQAEEDKNVRNIFKFNTPSDPYSSLIGVPLGSDKQKTDAVSPVHYVSKDCPSMLILHGTKDALVPYAQSVELAAALRGKGVEVLLQTLPGAGHGGPVFGKPEVNEMILKFFDKHLKGADVKVDLVPEAAVTVPDAPAKK
jgi:acetyl esterase/lipase